MSSFSGDLIVQKVANLMECIFFYKFFGLPTIFILFFGICIYLNVVLKFPGIRFFCKSFHLLRTKPNENSPGDVTPSQAMLTAVLSTVGFGAVAGVAVSVMIGGIGSIFWMIVSGILGLTVKFCEVALGVKYREIDGKNINGGPSYYIKKSLTELGKEKLGVIFSMIYGVCLLISAYCTIALFQMNQNAMIFADTFCACEENRHILATICTLITGITVLGGAKYVAKAGQLIMPALTVSYILCTLVIVGMHVTKLGGAIAAIMVDAFSGAHAVTGGFIGCMVSGSLRTMFFSEYGVGTSAIAHCRAKTDSHISAGLIAIPELLVVLAVAIFTGLAIVVTGVHQDGGAMGVVLTKNAFLSIGSFFQYVFPFFCFLLSTTTVIAWGYYGEMSWRFVFKNKAVFLFKLSFLATVYFGAFTKGADDIIRLAEYAWNLLGVPNFIVLFILCKMMKKDLNEYENAIK